MDKTQPKKHDHKPEVTARVGVERTRKRKTPLDRLTRDAIAAEQAGMSYGNYKAKHPHTPDEDEEPPRPKVDPGRYELTCATCGKVFYRTDKTHQKYCSYDCSKLAAAQRSAARREMKKQEEKAND